MAEQAAPLPTARSQLHFSLRDLLLFTALVAIYLSAAVQLDRLDAAANPFQPEGFLFRILRPSTFTFVIAIIFGAPLWQEDRKSTSKIGANQVHWRRTSVWTVSLLLAAVGLVAVWGVAPLFPKFVSPFAAGLGYLLALTVYVSLPIRIGENGISYQMGTSSLGRDSTWNSTKQIRRLR